MSKKRSPEYLKRKNHKKEQKRRNDIEYQKRKNQRKQEKLDADPIRKQTKYYTKYQNEISKRYDFLAYDGEGGNGKYTLLANSRDYIYNPDGLTTLECLTFLTKREYCKHRIFFFFGYDINLICKDIPKDDLLILFRSGTIQYGSFELSYVPRKMFKITLGKQTYVYYDTGTFFMSSLISAAKRNGIEIPDIITKGKKARGNDLMEWAEKDIVEYNRQECIILETLLDKLKEAFQLKVFGRTLEPRGYYGPGAVADVLLKALKVRNQTLSEPDINPDIQKLFPYAFFGARIEALKLGKFNDTIHSYDIRSAYPFQFSTLPEISTRWTKSKTPQDCVINPYSIWQVSWNIPKSEKHLPGPFPVRDKDGFIYFPGSGSGYYWGCELAEVLNVYPSKWFDIPVGWIMFDRGNKPFEKQTQFLFDYRNELKQNKDPRELALKLSLNSVYGKLIQNVGAKRYRSLIYAGLITAQTRAMLLQASAQDFKNIISFQTDGIKSLTPLSLDLSPKLGSWEYEKYCALQILGPGIYRTLDDKNNVHKNARGYNLKKFSFNSVCASVHSKGFADLHTQIFVGNLLSILQPEANGEYRNDFRAITRSYTPMRLDDTEEGHKKRVYNFLGYPNFTKENYTSQLYYPDPIINSHPYGNFKEDELDKLTEQALFEYETVLL